MKQNLDKLLELAEQVAGHKGLRVYDLELSGGGNGKILRVYIDKPGSNGVSLDDCSEFSNAYSLILDVEDAVEGHYNLEVSSPGIERDLKKTWHYAESVGETVSVSLREPLMKLHPNIEQQFASRKKITGLVKSLKEDVLEVEFEGRSITLPMQYVVKAHVVYDFSKKQEKGKEH